MVSAWCSHPVNGEAGVGTLTLSGKALGSSWAPSLGYIPTSTLEGAWLQDQLKALQTPLCPHPAPVKTGRTCREPGRERTQPGAFSALGIF